MIVIRNFQLFLLCLTCIQTHASDYVFNVGVDDVFSTSENLGCATKNCMVTKTWEFNGGCINPSVSWSIFQTDFLEQVDIYINDKYLDNCTKLILNGSTVCDHDWQDCGVVQQNQTNTCYPEYSLTITLEATHNIDWQLCPDHIGSVAYLWT